jgi:hypothetical protein
MKDRFISGFFAGIIAGILTNIWSFIAGAIGMTNLRTADLIGVIVYAKAPPFGFGETVFALLGHLLLTGTIGITFAYFLPHVGSRYIFFKGWLFSMTIWALIYGVTTFFKVPGTVPTTFNTALTAGISSTIYGLVLSFFWLKLCKKYSIS